MIDDQLFDRIDPLLSSLGSKPEDGEEFREPALDVLRYYRRTVKLGAIPILGRGLGVVAVVRQPIDVGLNDADYAKLLTRGGDGGERPVSPVAGSCHRPDLRGTHARADRTGRRRGARPGARAPACGGTGSCRSA